MEERRKTDIKYHNPSTLFSPPGFTHTVTAQGAGTWIYVSGQVATDQKGQVVGKGDIEAQTRQAFKNLEEALKAAGATFKEVVKVNIYLTDIRNIDVVRKVRTEFLDQKNPPAITSAGVTGLARQGALIEIEVIAAIP